MKLSSLLSCQRDADVIHTYYANSPLMQSICFVSTMEYLTIANNNPNISAIITTKGLAKDVSESKGLVIDENPKKVFFQLHNTLLEKGLNSLKVAHKIADTAIIAPTVKIYNNVTIGKNVIIDDYSVIYPNTIIGDNTYIGSHVTLGARGMHNTMIDGEFIHVKDAGGVLIGSGCEILSGAIVQKSYFSEFTKIGNASKVSVKVNIGHGSVAGKRTLIAGNAQVAGYNTIGDDVWIGPSAVLSHGLHIGDGAEIKIGSVVVKNVQAKEEVSGNFAYTHSKRVRNFIKEQRS